MKRSYTILLIFITLFLYRLDSFAQFILAQDTIRKTVDFCPRPSDFNNATPVPNDSVFYLYPPDLEIDPWRYVDHYNPDRSTNRGYIRGTDFIRVDDYEVVEVGKISAYGNVFFKNEDIRVDISVSKISPNNESLKRDIYGNYIINNKPAKGVNSRVPPKFHYQSISATIKGKKIVFPKKVYEHLLNPEIDNMVVYYNPEKSTVYIIADNGGIEAFYSAMWTVSQEGVSNVYIHEPPIKN